MTKKCDVAIIGSGPAGYVAAIRLRQLGKVVCVIDLNEERLGGVCLNEGCIPVKSLINSSKLFSAVTKSKDYGIDAEVKAIDMEKVTACAHESAGQLRNGIRSLFRKYEIEFISGKAKMISPHRISIKSENERVRELEADKIIIATGSRPEIPPAVNPDGKIIITSKEAIGVKKIPKTLLVIGAGAIGVEFCSMFASFGAKVTLAEMMSNVLPSHDEEISKALARIFRRKGIEVIVNAKVKSLNRKKGLVECLLDVGGTEERMEYECVLIATGRRPNTEGIGLEDLGIRSQDGFIIVDERMRTNIDSIYAVGDVINTPMYAHVAYKEGLTAAEDIAGIDAEPIDYENIPNVVFSEPQVADVGLTESKAKELGYELAISRHFFKANALAIASRREDGFIKIIADKKTRAILGVHIIGGEAAEILHEFVLAKNSKLSIDDIAKTVHAHPTFSEVAVDAAKAVFGKPIHG